MEDKEIYTSKENSDVAVPITKNDNKDRKIKSITLRNISLIILNCFLFISNLIFIYIKTL